MMLDKKRNISVIHETCNRIPKNSVGVELGVWKGEASELFLPLTTKLYLVDAWSIKAFKSSDEFGNYKGYLKRYSQMVGSNNPKDFQKFYDNIYESVKTKFEFTHAEIFRGTTHKFFESFTDKVDWVYVDASHSYRGCLSDLQNSLTILNPGGKIFGDDFHNKKGVSKAVREFVKVNNFDLDVFAGSQYEIQPKIPQIINKISIRQK